MVEVALAVFACLILIAIGMQIYRHLQAQLLILETEQVLASYDSNVE